MIIKKNFTIILLGLISVLLGCDKNKEPSWPGYVEGNYLFISSNIAGTLDTIKVKAGDNVEAKTLLFSLDSVPDQEEINAAKARLDQANAEERKAVAAFDLQKSIYNRKKGQYNKKSIKKEEFDVVKSNYKQADAGLAASKANKQASNAQLIKLKWMLDQKTQHSPIAAQVYETYFQEGENVNAGTPVLALLAPNQIKVIFYAQASDLEKIKLNHKVIVQCEGCSNPITANISYISPKAEFTPPVLYSTEVRSKLSFRIEATPEPTEHVKNLLPGQPVTVKL